MLCEVDSFHVPITLAELGDAFSPSTTILRASQRSARRLSWRTSCLRCLGMLIGMTSYTGLLWSQEDFEALPWHRMTIKLESNSSDAPTRSDLEGWKGLMPYQPNVKNSTWPWGHKEKSDFHYNLVLSDTDLALQNEIALERRLALNGWLDATVQAEWSTYWRGKELIIHVVPGKRWRIGEITWLTEGSGLESNRVEEIAALRSGEPFCIQDLQSSQDRIAAYARSIGKATFHTGHVHFEADTIGNNGSKLVQLTGECLQWDSEQIGQEFNPVDTIRLREHPNVFMGRLLWNHAPPGSREEYGGIRHEVWEHVSRLQPDDLFKPGNIVKTHSGLAALPAVHQVSRTEHLRFAEDTIGGELVSRVLMDVDYTVIPKASHDIGAELDIVRNDVRYGPKIRMSLLHRNPRGWGAQNTWEAAFGYVSASPFSSFNRETLLNSGEWGLSWGTTQIGISPFSLDRFRPSASPFTSLDLGWKREVWPEFSRSQIHIRYELGLIENPERRSTIRVSPVNISFIDLTNRDVQFVAWWEEQSPLVQGRFNNHLTLGSSAAWETGWSFNRWSGRYQVSTSWSGMLAQRFAEWMGGTLKFDETTGAWLVTQGVPIVQHQRLLTNISAKRSSVDVPGRAFAIHVLVGFANAGKNTTSLPLEQAFVGGGANGIRGWRLRTLGPGNSSSIENSSVIFGVGDVRLDLQIESRHPIKDGWSAAIFSDAGNVWLHGSGVDSETRISTTKWSGLGWSTGIGLRYDMEFFLLRIDGAMRLHDPTQQEGSRWIGANQIKGALHLGLGLPFNPFLHSESFTTSRNLW